MSPMTVKSCKSGASAEASTEGPRCEVVQFGVVPPIVGERSFEGELLFEGELSFEGEQLQPVAVVMSAGDIVTRAINIAAVADTLPVFIVAVRSQLAVRS
jgi:hypothetical protein